MSRIIIEGLDRKTNLGKTKSEIMYELVRSNAGNTNISTEDIVRRSARIYDNMISIGMIREYLTDDPNYPLRDEPFNM